MNRIGDVMDTVYASSVIYRGFEPLSGQTKDYKIGICCFFAKHARIIKDKETLWYVIRIMCPSGATCLSVDCCFSELELFK